METTVKTTEQKIEELEKQLQELKNEVAAQNKPKFKKGDFVYGEYRKFKQRFVFIFDKSKDTEESHHVSVMFINGNCCIKSGIIGYDFIRFATESEKKQLIEKLHEAGKDWDAEKCEIVDYRWMAEKGELYYYLMCTLDVRSCPDNHDACDKMNYNVGNYFKTKKLAEAAAEKVKKLLLTLKHS